MKILLPIKLLKTFLIFGLLINYVSASSLSDDPQWLVRITTTVGNETITGTGYLVKVRDKTFVRTAAHVTLGSEDVQLETGDGVKLSISAGKGVINNSYDDQLIEISETNLAPLGTYNREAKGFIVDQKVYEKGLKSKSRKDVEKFHDSAFYLVPSWTRGKPGTFKKKGSASLDAYQPGDHERQMLRISENDQVTYTETKITPGESGSPLIKRAAILEGEHTGIAPIIYGHAQSFQINFEHSSFSSPNQTAPMVEALLEGKKGEISETQWKRKNGVFYREKQTPEGVIREANFLSLVAGDGVVKSGGDGVVKNGGDGVVKNGGDGVVKNGGDGVVKNGGDGVVKNGGEGSNDPSERPAFGMIYKDKITYAFRVTKINEDGSIDKSVYYANWSNYLYTEKLLKENPAILIEPITDEESINSLILEKSKMDSKGGKSNERCSIDKTALETGTLILNIPGYETIVLDISGANALREFSPIQTLKSNLKNEKESLRLDLRGLFSIDSSEISQNQDFQGDTEANYYKAHPFITIGESNRIYDRLKCTVEANIETTHGVEVSVEDRENHKFLETQEVERSVGKTITK